MAERNSLKEWPRKPDGSRGSSEDRPANTSAGDLTEQRLPDGIVEGEGAPLGDRPGTEGEAGDTGVEPADAGATAEADAAEEAPPAKPGKAAKG